MPRRTKAESEQTKQRILATASPLFARDGYAGVSLDHVANLAGVTRGAVYHHYGGKLPLFEAVLAQVHAEVGGAVRRAAAAVGDDGWPAVEAGCRAFLVASVDDAVRRILLVDGPAVLGWHVWRRLDARNAGALLLTGLTVLSQDGQLAADADPAAAAALLSGAMNEAALWIAAATDRAVATDAAWSTLRSMLVALIRA